MTTTESDDKKKSIAISVTLQPDFMEEIDRAADKLRMKRVAFLSLV